MRSADDSHNSATYWHRFFDGDEDQVGYEWNGEAEAEQHEDLVELSHRKCIRNFERVG